MSRRRAASSRRNSEANHAPLFCSSDIKQLRLRVHSERAGLGSSHAAGQISLGEPSRRRQQLTKGMHALSSTRSLKKCSPNLFRTRWGFQLIDTGEGEAIERAFLCQFLRAWATDAIVI
jgi:hypothetical protein